MRIFLIATCLIQLFACTSKNRFENGSSRTPEPSTSQPSGQTQPGSDRIKGSITDVESDAIPFLKIEADTPRWSMSMGLIQDGIFDVKLDMSSENRIYFGLMKKIQEPNQNGIFYVGELNSNNGKHIIQLYVQRLPCTDSDNAQHSARVTLLKDNKEYYACGDFQN